MLATPSPSPFDDQARADAFHAQCLAMNLDDHASREHIAAVVSLLLQHCDADPTRLAQAETVCRSHRLEHEADELGDMYRQAEQLLSEALRSVVDAGAEDDESARDQLRQDLHAQWNPEPVPFQWPRDRRRHLGWWLRWLTTRPIRIHHSPLTGPAAVQRMTLHVRGSEVGKMLYQVCDKCRQILIGKVSITASYQGLGIGTRAVMYTFHKYPRYTWYTSAQYDTAGTFWKHMAQRTGAAFTDDPDAACPHMRQGQ